MRGAGGVQRLQDKEAAQRMEGWGCGPVVGGGRRESKAGELRIHLAGLVTSSYTGETDIV